MTPPRSIRFVFAASVLAGLAACASNVKLDESPVETRQATPVASTDTTSSSTPGGTQGPSGPGSTTAGAGSGAGPASGSTTVATVRTAPATAGDTAGWPAQRTVYFDFDSFTVRPDAQPVIEGHAKVLAANKGKRLLIEGHTDERGGREYNLALGQKRAEAVARSLVLLGAADGQLEAVSYGKERPAVEGSGEAAWEKNRRAELKEKR
jgi:peptidoglycan-associated lipoprotein